MIGSIPDHWQYISPRFSLIYRLNAKTLLKQILEKKNCKIWCLIINYFSFYLKKLSSLMKKINKIKIVLWVWRRKLADIMTKWRDDDFTSEKSQTCGHRKIPLTLLSVFQSPPELVSKTQSCETVFLNQCRKNLLFDKS